MLRIVIVLLRVRPSCKKYVTHLPTTPVRPYALGCSTVIEILAHFKKSVCTTRTNDRT